MSEQKMRELVDKLNAAKKSYYNGSPHISDHEYDQMLAELEELEKSTGVILDDSPTILVGAEPKSNWLEKVEHEFKPKSLDKTKDKSALINAFRINGSKDQVNVMWKLDGSTAQLTYFDGKLSLAATRGNGVVGQNITENAKQIVGIPHEISYKEKLVVRGEAVMSYPDFEALNETVDLKFKNPRNLANGTIAGLDPSVVKERKIRFFAFELVYSEDMSKMSFSQRLNRLGELGFGVVEHELSTVDSVEEVIDSFSDRAEDYFIPVDGLVLAYENTGLTDDLEGTEHHPNILKGYAYKWQDEEVETTVKYIEWTPSRTGLLNPVAVFEPVEIEGTTVQRASLHNYSIMKSMQIRPGDTVAVYKANKIIPQVAKNLTPKGEYAKGELIGECPDCGEQGVITVSKDGIESIYCANPNCPAKIVQKLTYFASREALDISGLSETTIAKFCENGWLSSWDDLFTFLDEHENEIKEMPGFGVKSYNNLKEAINKASRTTFEKFVVGLGIPMVGVKQAKTLSDIYDGDIYKFLADDSEKYRGSFGFGEVISTNIQKWLKDQATQEEVQKVLGHITIVKPKKEVVASDNLSGLNFVITGKLEKSKNRDELVKLIESNGGSVQSSVNKKTSFLVNNDINSKSSKNTKAKQLGVKIITENELLEKIGL